MKEKACKTSKSHLKHDDIDEGASGEPLQDGRRLTCCARQLRHCQPDPNTNWADYNWLALLADYDWLTLLADYNWLALLADYDYMQSQREVSSPYEWEGDEEESKAESTDPGLQQLHTEPECLQKMRRKDLKFRRTWFFWYLYVNRVYKVQVNKR